MIAHSLFSNQLTYWRSAFKFLTVVYYVDTFFSAVCVINRNWYHGKHLTAKISQGPLKKNQQVKTRTLCTALAHQKWSYDNTTQWRACVINLLCIVVTICLLIGEKATVSYGKQHNRLFCRLRAQCMNSKFSTTSLASALNTGVTLARFHKEGTLPDLKDELNKRTRGYDSSSAHSLRIAAEIPSTPVALLASSWLRIDLTSLRVVDTSISRLGLTASTWRLTESNALVEKTELKNSLNSEALSTGSLTDLDLPVEVNTSGILLRNSEMTEWLYS